MKLRYALIAEYANVTGDGKLNLMGVTDRLYAFQFPAIHRDLIIVNSLETENDEDGSNQSVHIQLIDSDGRTLTEVTGQILIQGGRQVFNQIHVFQDVHFAQPGAYQINVSFSGQQQAILDLELIQIQQPEVV
ncbi:MAG: hypothetical protein ABL962_06735 [Fimbriimonadaceae bacterium]